ncbi:plasmid recombination protein [Paucibacter sp. Y2R2-4]|uniref:plasmid recombination protein n=1 Tax=Paucibacter sp. Y2R2-4 TaxID=2893553 RepID=UPI0021E484AF|nr:plasmid recombination protein [Paucibacter sp. Y2R2-4]MCV2352281.1 plasmid recombination protein [Paucibacter sp. Y2R2-4]
MKGGKARAKGAGGVECFLNIYKLNSKKKGPRAIFKAAQHNLRSNPAEYGRRGNIDPDRICLNEVLIGPDKPEEVEAQAQQRMDELGIKPRAGAVLAIELLFSLPAGHGLNDRDVFMACVEWAGRQFGGPENILSAVVHLDEATPHCHALILPILEGRLNASELVGYKKEVSERRNNFYEELGKSHGLKKPRSEKLSGEDIARGGGQVIAHMEKSGDAATNSAAWEAIKAVILRNPQPFMECLGLEPLAKPSRDFIQIMTGTGCKTLEDKQLYRGSENIYRGSQKLYRETSEPCVGGEEIYRGAGKVLPLSCVEEGFQSLQSGPLPESQQRDAEERQAATQGQGLAVQSVDADGVIEFVAATDGAEPAGNSCGAVVIPELQQQGQPIGHVVSPGSASGAGQLDGQDLTQMVFDSCDEAVGARRAAGKVRQLWLYGPFESGLAGWRLIDRPANPAEVADSLILAAKGEGKSCGGLRGDAAVDRVDDCLQPYEAAPGCWRYKLLRDVALGPAVGLSREQRRRVMKAWKKAGAWDRV